jgi:hypothetical protein
LTIHNSPLTTRYDFCKLLNYELARYIRTGFKAHQRYY